LVSLVTAFDGASPSVLSPAVMRSVSVTDFLSFLADQVDARVPDSREQSANSPKRPIIDSATMIARIGG
jgi:hypothetical protein